VPLFDLVRGHDVRRPSTRLGEFELADLLLHVPRVVDAPFDPRIADPDRVRPRQPADLGGMPGAEDQHFQPVGAAAERVLEVVRELNDAVAGADLADLLVLPREARAAEDVVDLLGGAVGVRRRGVASIGPFVRCCFSTSSQ